MSDITAYTIISRDLMLLRWAVENARARAGIDHEWLVILWINPNEPSENPERITKWCEGNGVRVIPFVAPLESEFPDRTSWFLKCLYHGWNLGYSESKTKWVARLGSDQFFSKGWLLRLMEAASRYGDHIYHCHTVESPLARHSRHDIQDWGDTWQTFDLIRFEQYASERAWRWQHQLVVPGEESGLFYHHPTRGPQQRCDSISWIQTKALYEEFAPMKDCINAEGVTGDVDWFDRMGDAEVKQFLVPSVTGFHLVRGESRGVQAK